MQSSKEQQGEIRKPSEVINTKTQKKTQSGKDQRSLQKARDIKGTFHAITSTIKDRNGKDLTEAEENKWRKYTEELYKNGLNEPDSHDGVVTHLEPDILECEVK